MGLDVVPEDIVDLTDWIFWMALALQSVS